MPRPDILKQAVTEYDEKLVSMAQIATLVRVWPKDSNLEDLGNETLNEGEVWEKGEAYMINLITPASLLNRLKVWTFKGTWSEEKEVVEIFYTRIMNAYKEIETNKYFLKIVGMTLSIGNILNGGTPKGQADGFDLPVLGKLVSMKDNTNQTLLQLICKKIADEDPDFPEAAKALNKSVQIKEVDTKYLKTKTVELQGMYGTARAQFAQVTGSGD